MKAELSSCLIQKFNTYEFLRSKLTIYEKKNFLLLDIAYEPTQDIAKPIYCFFAPEIHSAFQTFYDLSRSGKKVKIKTSRTKQCPYCEKKFLKSQKKM